MSWILISRVYKYDNKKTLTVVIHKNIRNKTPNFMKNNRIGI